MRIWGIFSLFSLRHKDMPIISAPFRNSIHLYTWFRILQMEILTPPFHIVSGRKALYMLSPTRICIIVSYWSTQDGAIYPISYLSTQPTPSLSRPPLSHASENWSRHSVSLQRRPPHILGCGLTGVSGEVWERKRTVQEMVASYKKKYIHIYCTRGFSPMPQTCAQNKQQSKRQTYSKYCKN